MTNKRPAWREPMVWLVAGLPLISVIAGIGLLVIATRSGNDSVADPVRRTAQIQTADLGPDALAQQLRLSAIVRLDDKGVQLLPVSGEFRRDLPLQLRLRHPANADQDQELVLQADEDGWSTTATIDRRHDWNVELLPKDGHWRLQGRIQRGLRAAHLKPALSEP